MTPFKDNYITNVTTEIPRGGRDCRGATRVQVDIEHNEVVIRQLHGDLGRLRVEQLPERDAGQPNQLQQHSPRRAGHGRWGGHLYPVQPGAESLMEYNYVHDFGTSPWADYGTATLYFDEGTRGYTAEHNVMVNCNGQINTNSDDKFDTCNSGGGNTITDNSSNPSGAQTTIADAGLEPAYVNIKNMTVPRHVLRSGLVPHSLKSLLHDANSPFARSLVPGGQPRPPGRQ